MRFKNIIRKILNSEKKETLKLFKKVTQEIEDFILIEKELVLSHEMSRSMHFQFNSNKNGIWIQDKPYQFLSLFNKSPYFYFNKDNFKSPHCAIDLNFPFFIDKDLKKLKYNDIYIEINGKEKIFKKECNGLNYLLSYSNKNKFKKDKIQIKEKDCSYASIMKDLEEINRLFNDTMHFFITFIKNKGAYINKEYLSKFININKENKNLLLLTLFSSEEEYQKNFVEGFLQNKVEIKKKDIYDFFYSLQDNVIRTEDNIATIFVIENKMKEVFLDIENGFNTHVLSHYLNHQDLTEKLVIKDDVKIKRTKI